MWTVIVDREPSRYIDENHSLVPFVLAAVASLRYTGIPPEAVLHARGYIWYVVDHLLILHEEENPRDGAVIRVTVIKPLW